MIYFLSINEFFIGDIKLEGIDFCCSWLIVLIPTVYIDQPSWTQPSEYIQRWVSPVFTAWPFEYYSLNMYRGKDYDNGSSN